MKKTERYKAIIDYFQATMPVAETELEYENPFHLIVAVILSAQCTDKRVNQITPSLLKRYPTPELMAEADQAEVFEYIRSCSFPNNKSKHLVNMAQMLVSDFKGEVPSDIDALQKLPGVGRKTANVIASVVYNQPAMAVDTHVFRVSARIGLTTAAKTPLAAEKQLIQYIPVDLVSTAHHWLILHGRYVCKARRPLCSQCGLTAVCKFFASANKEKA